MIFEEMVFGPLFEYNNILIGGPVFLGEKMKRLLY